MNPVRFDIQKFHCRKVVVFGDYMVDEYLQGAVSRISPEAPVPVVKVLERNQRLGGAGNVVLNLMALGAKPFAVTCFGNDAAGQWLMDCLEQHHVDTAGIFRSSELTTSIKTRVTAQNQQLLRYDQESIRNASKAFIDFINDKHELIFQDACAVIISDYGKGVVTDDTAQLMIRWAKEHRIPVVVDPKGSDYKKYRGADACTPNMKELELAVGRKIDSEDDISEAGKELYRTCGILHTLATRSEKGMSLIDGATGEKWDYPALAKEVTDVTGAGDTVISVYTLCLALGAHRDDRCRLANVAASIVVSKFGAAVATPKEIRDLIEGQDQISSKILTKEEAAKRAAFHRAHGEKIVFTNGCFDIVHAGHISSFKQAREHGDVLFLGLNSDSSIKRIKGDKRPIVDQNNRMALLAAISYVDYIVLFEEDTPEELIKTIKPDVLIKGKDWAGKPVAGADFIHSIGGQVCFIDLEAGLSTSNIITKILTVYGGHT